MLPNVLWFAGKNCVKAEKSLLQFSSSLQFAFAIPLVERLEGKKSKPGRPPKVKQAFSLCAIDTKESFPPLQPTMR